jgi:hypothetical protein
MATNLRQQRLRATWVTYREVPLWCCDFGGFGSDRTSLQAEIAASQAVIDQRPENSLLVAVDLSDVTLTPDIVIFFETNAGRARNPIRKLAILGLSDFQRWWYRRVKHVVWPKQSNFFHDWEQAKKWLVSET